MNQEVEVIQPQTDIEEVDLFDALTPPVIVQTTQPKIERAWAMPKSNLARIKPVSDFLMETFGELDVMDAFHPDCLPLPEIYAPDAYQLMADSGEQLGGILHRPPITWGQAEAYVKRHGMKWDGTTRWWSSMKDNIARITAVNGIVATIGWDSNGMGKSRGFVMERILMVAHGGHWHDTICTVERKIN